MEVNKVKELMDLMKSNDLTELEIVDGQTRIVLKRGTGSAMPMVTMAPMVAPAALTGGIPAAGSSAPAAGGVVESGAGEEKLIEIPSPIVGTFYAAPSPTAEPFVKVGSTVDEESVVCIVEAMKVMNEVKAEIRGTIRKILVNNGQSVEYGQPLFLVKPD